MNNIQKYIVLLLMVMLFVPNTAWAQTNKQEFVIKGVVEDNLGPVAGASIIAKISRVWVRLLILMESFLLKWGPMM